MPVDFLLEVPEDEVELATKIADKMGWGMFSLSRNMNNDTYRIE
jgi:hypothetical protein